MHVYNVHNYAQLCTREVADCVIGHVRAAAGHVERKRRRGNARGALAAGRLSLSSTALQPSCVAKACTVGLSRIECRRYPVRAMRWRENQRMTGVGAGE